MGNLFKSTTFLNFVFVVVGSIFSAIGVVSFLVPNSLITGGTAGLALLLHHVSFLTIGTWMFLINVPLVLLGIKYFGKMYAVKSVATIIFISLLIDFLKEYISLPAATSETLLASIFGGVFIGLGLGFIIRGKSSAGGSSIIATIIASTTKYKASEAMLFIDAAVILFSIYVFDDIDKALWSIVSIYVTSKIVDVILTGRPSKKVVHLVTNKVEVLAKEVKEKLGPEGTIIKGENLSSNGEKKMILIVVEISKIQVLKEIAKSNDPESFLVISEASELLGRGN